MLDPTLFNILLNDLFFIIKDTNFANYVDHNTIYKAIINIDTSLHITTVIWKALQMFLR